VEQPVQKGNVRIAPKWKFIERLIFVPNLIIDKHEISPAKVW